MYVILWIYTQPTGKRAGRLGQLLAAMVPVHMELREDGLPRQLRHRQPRRLVGDLKHHGAVHAFAERLLRHRKQLLKPLWLDARQRRVELLRRHRIQLLLEHAGLQVERVPIFARGPEPEGLVTHGQLRDHAVVRGVPLPATVEGTRPSLLRRQRVLVLARPRLRHGEVKARAPIRCGVARATDVPRSQGEPCAEVDELVAVVRHTGESDCTKLGVKKQHRALEFTGAPPLEPRWLRKWRCQHI